MTYLLIDKAQFRVRVCIQPKLNYAYLSLGGLCLIN